MQSEGMSQIQQPASEGEQPMADGNQDIDRGAKQRYLVREIIDKGYDEVDFFKDQ